MRSLVVFLFLVLFMQNGFAFTKISPKRLLSDAQSAYLKGELFDSYRYYLLILDKNPTMLDPADVSSIISISQILNNQRDFKSLCNRFLLVKTIQDIAAVHCSKSMIKKKKYKEALLFLNEVTEQGKKDFDVNVLKASIYLTLGNSDNCLEIIRSIAEKDLRLKQKDLRNVTEARCLVQARKFDEAILAFQQVKPDSPYYTSTLEEQAWIQFKNRKFESVTDLLDVIISVYDQNQSLNEPNSTHFDDSYYRSRYLKGYLEFVKNNTHRSQVYLNQLTGDIEAYKKRNSYGKGVIRNIYRQILKISSIPALEKRQLRVLKSVRQYISAWADLSYTVRINDSIRYIISVNREIKRVETLNSNGKFNKYIKKLETLKLAMSKETVKGIYNGILRSNRALDSLAFKARMGHLENYWANRNEGKRTLAEVTESYKAKVSRVEDTLGKNK